MWSPVQALNVSSNYGKGSPVSRCKHAMCVAPDGHIYLYGGRSANLPLKDLWRFDAGQNQWEEVECRGQHPPNLQEHTMIAWKNKLYVFGGEIGFSSSGETPLWILDLSTTTWNKHALNQLPSTSPSVAPTGRRGHTTILYGDAMHIYGGYQDLHGSSSELWTFDFITEQWHLLSSPSSSQDHPPPRHSHSAVMHNNCLYIFGGMTDLNVRSDFWKWDFAKRRWFRIKANKGPGDLYGHTAIEAFNSMFVFGGERSGTLLRDLWRFHFDSEHWERINAEGIIPSSRCRHVAIPNPFIDIIEDSHNNTNNNINNNNRKHNKILRLSSKSNCISSLQNDNKVVTTVRGPTKSISMCFGQPNDTPLHDNVKTIKPFKLKVHPMPGFCSGRSATLSDDEEEVDNESNSVSNENFGTDFDNHTNPVTMRKSLKDKISRSRLVRSLSTNSYNILHQNIISNEDLKDDLEKLVEESTPEMQRLNGILTNKSDGNYYRLNTRTKLPKSISSNAVLESDSESSTPQRHSNRPLSEVIQSQTPVEDDINNQMWIKRRSVHESMSYYSLCFPTPPNLSKSNSETSTTSIDNNPGHQLRNRLIPSSFDKNLLEFDEDLDNLQLIGNIRQIDNKSLSPEDSINTSNTSTSTPLIELDDQNANIMTISSPVECQPKSSGFNSSLTLYTPSVDSRGIPHSVSHSSGYQSFTDEAIYDHKEFAGTLQTSTLPRRVMSARQTRDLMELKNLSAKLSDQLHNQIAENGSVLPVTLRAGLMTKENRENRARSWDRVSRRESFVRGNMTPGCDNRISWQPNINVIKEVVVPGSPASHKWSYSPAKTKAHQHHWQLCMYIFGGKEKGITGVYKQPMTVWKFYI